MAGAETEYVDVAVCSTENRKWELKDWEAFDAEVTLDETFLVRADELLLPAGDAPPAGWAPTGEQVGRLRRHRRRALGVPSKLPPSGVPVLEAVASHPTASPNAVFCVQALRPEDTQEENGPFTVAPRYQGIGGDGPQPEELERELRAPRRGRRVQVAVVDTGLGQGRYACRALEPFVAARGLVAAAVEDHPDLDHDEELDPVAGHGMAVAWQVPVRERQTQLHVARAVDRQGAVTDFDLAQALAELRQIVDAPFDVLNLSLGGWTYNDAEPPAVAAVLKQLIDEGTAVVAAAGNQSSDRPFWPAAMPDVIGVGAAVRSGDEWVAEEWSNRGPWVKVAVEARTPVGAFYEQFRGFQGGARWQGTSFLAPQVAGAVARMAVKHGLTGQEAWMRLESDEPSPADMPNALTLTTEALA